MVHRKYYLIPERERESLLKIHRNEMKSSRTTNKSAYNTDKHIYEEGERERLYHIFLGSPKTNSSFVCISWVLCSLRSLRIFDVPFLSSSSSDRRKADYIENVFACACVFVYFHWNGNANAEYFFWLVCLCDDFDLVSGNSSANDIMCANDEVSSYQIKCKRLDW